jgi:hypothetical protein
MDEKHAAEKYRQLPAEVLVAWQKANETGADIPYEAILGPNGKITLDSPFAREVLTRKN